MRIFQRSRRQRGDEQAPTTAELREQRLLDWQERFPDASSEDEYRRAFLNHSPLYWDIVQSTQRELLRLLVGRVPADLGVPAIFSVTVIFGEHPKADDAARATLSTIIHELKPAHARTLLVSLADAWHNAEHCPYDERGAAVAGEFGRTLRRLQSTAAEDTGAVSSIRSWLGISDNEED